ncbi:hypothetical protein OG618_03030 [Kitasatospora sp. NBC_01246]|uniref:hypothetical protein n=1 Tax=Kitasatospora sp. NBC_01246 TaxID=2903570 RepID=UPI002E30538E|nr:hypothetical protein [Kitasatospora sp. NBC_01246]
MDRTTAPTTAPTTGPARRPEPLRGSETRWGPEPRRGSDRHVDRALRASALPAYWARHYACLRDPAAGAAAERHVRGSVALLPLPYRLGYAAALRALPALFRCATGHSLRLAPASADRTGMARLGRLPGVAEVIRASTALALYGALDGHPGGPGAPGSAVRRAPRVAAP